MTAPFTHEVRLPDGSTAEQIDTGNYYVDYHRGGPTLVVTFENRDYSQTDPARFAWGFDKLRRLGHSVIGVKIKRCDWYLGPDLADFFASEAMRAIGADAARVLFYGSSMGGCGALRFAWPGSEVLAFNPQTSLDPAVVPWDDRYSDGSSQDWSGPDADAAIGARRAARIFVAYDPLFSPDRRHVERLDQANLILLKLPLVGHTMPAHLAYMDLLETVLDRFLAGTLDAAGWAALVRRRRAYSHYYLTFAQKTRSRAVAARCLEHAAANRPYLVNNVDALVAIAERHGLACEAVDALDRMINAGHPTLGDTEAAARLRGLVD